MSKVLALLIRALRTESRDIKSHLFRFGLAAIIVMILWIGAASIGRETAPGRTIFQAMIVANWVFVTLAAGTFFSIAISEETEQQTLGLLRMANVSPLALLLGKWLPRLSTAFLLILVQFPFTWLTVTLGGVSWHQIWASYLLLLAHLFLVGNLGLLCSVLRPNSASACALTFTIMILARLLPWLVYAALLILAGFEILTRDPSIRFYEYVIVPLADCSASSQLFGPILATSFQGSPWTMQVISNLALGGLLFGASWAIFDRVTMRHMSGGPAATGFLQRSFRLFRGKSQRRSSPVWDWAIGWKDFRQVVGGRRTIVAKFLLYAFLFGLIFVVTQLNGYSSMDRNLETSCAVVGSIILFFLLPLELCFTAARLFRPELNDHTWSTLLTLPKSLPQIAYAKLGGAAIGLIPSIVCLSLVGIPFLSEIIREITHDSSFILVVGYCLSIAVCVLHLITFYSITISWAAWPIAVILGAGTAWLANSVLWIMFAMMSMFGGSGGDKVVMGYVLLLSIGNLVGAVLLHFGIGHRLEAKGAES